MNYELDSLSHISALLLCKTQSALLAFSVLFPLPTVR